MPTTVSGNLIDCSRSTGPSFNVFIPYDMHVTNGVSGILSDAMESNFVWGNSSSSIWVSNVNTLR